MKITPQELIDLGLWEQYCRETGTNVYAVKEGLDANQELIWDRKREI